MSTSSLFSWFFRDFDIEIFWCTLELHFFCGIVVYRREVSIVFWHSKCVVLALLIFFFHCCAQLEKNFSPVFWSKLIIVYKEDTEFDMRYFVEKTGLQMKKREGFSFNHSRTKSQELNRENIIGQLMVWTVLLFPLKINLNHCIA